MLIEKIAALELQSAKHTYKLAGRSMIVKANHAHLRVYDWSNMIGLNNHTVACQFGY
jgi:hypothetical protein